MYAVSCPDSVGTEQTGSNNLEQVASDPHDCRVCRIWGTADQFVSVQDFQQGQSLVLSSCPASTQIQTRLLLVD